MDFAHGAIQWLAADGVGTTYTVSGLSFQPKALRFYWMGLQPAADAEWVSVVIEQFDHRITVGDDLNETEHAALSLGDEPVEATGCGMVWEAQP